LKANLAEQPRGLKTQLGSSPQADRWTQPIWNGSVLLCPSALRATLIASNQEC
jgi:hypothetical protein